MRKNLFSSQRGVAVSGLLFLVVILLLAFSFIFYTFGYVVPPGMMGVRQITMQIPLGPKQGYSSKALSPGYHWSIPFYSYIYKLPQTVQSFHFGRGMSAQNGSEALEIQTSDGSSVLVDVTVLYRFFSEPSERNGGPSDLFTKAGNLSGDWIDRIRTAAENKLKDSLGKLSTSDFYNPHAREKQLQLAFASMSERLLPLGIKVEDVLLRRYVYSEERIDQAIFEKNLQNQEERLNAASSRLADASAKLEAVAAEWDAKITTLKVDGENQSAVLRSEGALYEAKKTAEGDLLVAKAKAESDRLKAKVFSESAGAEVYVAREMAPVIGALKGGIVSGVNPFDIEAWTKRFGVRSEK